MRCRNFETDAIRDVEGDEIPAGEDADLRIGGSEREWPCAVRARNRRSSTTFSPSAVRTVGVHARRSSRRSSRRSGPGWRRSGSGCRRMPRFESARLTEACARSSNRPANRSETSHWKSRFFSIEPCRLRLRDPSSSARLGMTVHALHLAASHIANFRATARHPAVRGHNFLVSEIKLNGGEITILKTLGLTGGIDGGHAVGGSY